MRKLILVAALAAALPLASCGTPPSDLASLPAPPQVPASKLHRAEQAYQAATIALEAAIVSGRLTGQAAARAAKADDVAYAALQVARELFATIGQVDALADANDEAHRKLQASLAVAAD